MTKNHLKRNIASKRWELLRKKDKFVSRPLPGKHVFNDCMPMGAFLKQVGFANTTKEGKKLLLLNKVLVDKIAVKKVKQAVGFMDIVSVNDKNFRCIFGEKGRFNFIEIDSAEAGKKICRILNKTKIKKGKTQLSLSDSRNILVDKDDFKCNDSIVIELPSQKIIKHLPYKEGAVIILMSGKQAGNIGRIEKILDNHIWYKDDKGSKFSTLKNYAFVIGIEKPEIKIR